MGNSGKATNLEIPDGVETFLPHSYLHCTICCVNSWWKVLYFYDVFGTPSFRCRLYDHKFAPNNFFLDLNNQSSCGNGTRDCEIISDPHSNELRIVICASGEEQPVCDSG